MEEFGHYSLIFVKGRYTKQTDTTINRTFDSMVSLPESESRTIARNAVLHFQYSRASAGHINPMQNFLEKIGLADRAQPTMALENGHMLAFDLRSS